MPVISPALMFLCVENKRLWGTVWDRCRWSCTVYSVQSNDYRETDIRRLLESTQCNVRVYHPTYW